MSDTIGHSAQGLSRKVAEFSHGFQLEQVPPSVLNHAKLAILDCLGVSVLAASQEIGDCLRKFARAQVTPGGCAVWGTDLTAGTRDAAFLNGTLAHGLDYDDRNHSTTYTLATAIAAAESVKAPGRKALEGFIVGREVRASLDRIFSARSSGVGPGARGWHSNGILGPLASACAASKVLALDPRQTLAAIGLAAGSCGALTRDGGTMAKPFRCGHAAATGLTSALLAREGFTSDETILEGRYGLLEAVGPLSEEILDSLGRNLGSEWDLGQSLRIKPFASCTATHSALEAMLRLLQREKIAPDAVEAIECDLRPYPLVRTHPTRSFEGRFSMPFCLSMALVFGDLRPDDFTEERLQNPAVQRLIERTRHVPHLEQVTVILKNNTRLTEALKPAANLSALAEVHEKFRQSVSKTFSPRRTQEIIDQVASLEKLPAIGLLTKLLQTG